MRKCGGMQQANSDTTLRQTRQGSDTETFVPATTGAAPNYGLAAFYPALMSQCGHSCADTTVSQMSHRLATENSIAATNRVTFQARADTEARTRWIGRPTQSQEWAVMQRSPCTRITGQRCYTPGIWRVTVAAVMPFDHRGTSADQGPPGPPPDSSINDSGERRACTGSSSRPGSGISALNTSLQACAERHAFWNRNSRTCCLPHPASLKNPMCSGQTTKIISRCCGPRPSNIVR